MTRLQLLQEKQPIVYNILNNALNANKLAHAYLFGGVKGSLQDEVALLLVQSLFCEESAWACGECPICKRLENNVYPDMIVLDGSVSSIKKADVLDLQQRFSMTSLEKYVYKIFIIKDAHNMTSGAANSLLKFLEEPTPNVLGVLISDEIEAILPTVISRCQVINFRQLSYLDNLELAKANNIDDLNAYYYAKVVSNHLSLNDFMESEAFQIFTLTFENFVNLFDTKPDLALYKIHSMLISNKDKDLVNMAYALFIDMVIVFFGDVITPSPKANVWYDESVLRYRNNVNYSAILHVVLESKSQLGRSVNLALAVDQMFYNLKEVM